MLQKQDINVVLDGEDKAHAVDHVSIRSMKRLHDVILTSKSGLTRAPLVCVYL